MATIDDKVVAMSFESDKFVQGVDRALESLKKLQDSLRFPEAGKGLQAVSAQAKELDFGHITKSVDGIAEKLGALRLVAIAVFADLAKKALSAGTQMVKALTITPLLQGFHEYETQINAVQTILANTSAAGTGIKDVNRALDELNNYADKTIYNFSEMTRNIGTFTAAGVDLKTSVASIKGIANLAAVSGSNAQQASTAMYQLSQAISSGTVKLMDWNSVVNAGMGGTVFQRALAQTAQHMGTLKKGAVELSGPMKNVRINGESFRNSLSAPPGKEGWLSSKVLTETLKQLSGDMTDAQLKAQGYTDAQIKAIQTQAKMAVEAATRIKTLTQLISTTKEQLGSGWAQTWRIIVGDFLQARKLFTSISDAIGGIIMRSAQARNKVLKDWRKLGGRQDLIEGLKNVFHALGAVIHQVSAAFHEIFPPVTGKKLADLTKRFEAFTKTLMPSMETVAALRNIFRGVFAIFDIGKQIVQGIFTVFKKLFGAMDGGGSSILGLAAKIGYVIYQFDQSLKKGKGIQKFFEKLGDILAKPIELLGKLGRALLNVFSGGAAAGVEGVTKAVGPLSAALSFLGDILHRVFDQISQLAGIFEPILQAWVDLLVQLPSLIGQALSNMSWEPILAVIRTGLLAGIFLMFKKFLGKGAFSDQLARSFAGIGGGILKNINASFSALTGSLQALQQNLKAKTLLDIAIAVGILAASMVALSFVDPKRLNSALGAITIAFGQLLGAMAILGNVTKTMGFIKMPVLASTLIILAGAIFTLSASVVLLSRLSWEELAKGLTAVAVLLVGITAIAPKLGGSSAGLIRAGAGITAVAVGLTILAVAMKIFATMDLFELGKGLAAIGIGLFIIATYSKMMPKGLIATGAGLIAIAVGLNLLALAVLSLGSMDLMTLGKGIGAIGLTLVILAGAMRLMPSMAASAAGLLILSVALNGIALAVRSLGGMSLEQLGKGLGSLAISLAILAGALHLMQGAIGGAIALGIAAAGIALLIPALVMLGKQNLKTLAVGVIALAVALGIIAGIGILLDAAAPGILAFGVAVALVGAGLALAGAGIMLAALGVSALVAAIVVAAGVIPQAFVDLQKSLVENAKLLVLGLLEIVQAFADTAPQFVDAIIKILTSVIDAIIQLMPKIEELTTILIETIIRVLDQQQGPIIEAAIGLIMALLTGIRNHIGEVVKVALEIVQNLILGIAKNIGKVTSAGAKLVIALITGIAKFYVKIVSAVLGLITTFLGAIASNLGKIVTAGGRIITSLLNGIANNIRRVASAATNVIVAFINGIGNMGPRVITAATNTIIKFINALQKNANRLADAGAKAIVAFMNGIANSINTYAPQMRQAGWNIAVALVNGMTGGLASKGAEMIRKAGDLVNKVKNKLKVWDSPPEAFGKNIGQSIVLGLAAGLSDNDKAIDGAATMSQGVIDTTKSIFEIASPSKVMEKLGREVAAGLANGVKEGAEEDVRQALQDVQTLVAQQIADARQKISQARQEINRAEKGKKLTREQIAQNRKLNQVIEENNAILQKSTRFHKLLTNEITAHKGRLIELSKEYAKTSEQLDIATNLFEQYVDQYADLPEIPTEDEEGNKITDPLAAYIEKLKRQVGDVQAYAAVLTQLKAAGLDDKTYQMLLDAGPAVGMALAQGLLTGGASAIQQVNSLDSQLSIAASGLADNAAKELYDVGKATAQGFVKGLQDHRDAILNEMNTIADAMVKRIKAKLKIKSPSEIFAEIGVQSIQGMAQGITNATSLVTDAAENVATDAVDAIRSTLASIPVDDFMEMNPVITPILDLTAVQEGAARMAGMIPTSPVAAASYGQASSISAAETAIAEEKVAAIGGPAVKFEQNNYSPEALSDIEIYRQTKNQLSQIKSVLALT